MEKRDEPPEHLDPDIARHYELGAEGGRLARGGGLVEEARTREVLTRHLPPSPARVLDVGGGPGPYAAWLEGLGYDVRLIDPVPLHVEQARHVLHRGTAAVGDARRIDEPDASCDAVLLLGPLYHLTESVDRVQALREARRVVRAGGVVVAAGISRFASAFDGMARGHLADAAFDRIVEGDLRDGRHRNPTGHPAWFTSAYFHRPEELRDEVERAGLSSVELVGLEGPTWLLGDLEAQWTDAERRARWMRILGALETEPSLLGVSAHLLAIAKRLD